jgi:hypothetical protein
MKIENLNPRQGRFYPKGLLSDLPGVYSANLEPFRCVQISNGHMDVDLGHPMASVPLDLTVTVGAIKNKREERGGTVRNWAEVITQGTGMQARWRNVPTDFFSDTPFRRENDESDVDFYSRPRLVSHIDENARGVIEQVYGRFLRQDMLVLDLMSSWQSHIAGDLRLSRLEGLGLNKVELANNNQLSGYFVHDLNQDPTIPKPGGIYDAVLCTVSVEYLIHPIAVFREVARVLKPGGHFIVTFSNRWFPPKVVRIWTELHEFERMGLVLEYFRQSQSFTNYETFSMRGLSRPFNDKYFGRLPYSDPVYAVWAQKT